MSTQNGLRNCGSRNLASPAGLSWGGLFFALALTIGLFQVAVFPQNLNKSSAPRLVAVAEYKVPALESEVAGIYPHLTDDNLYLIAANKHPAYRAGQKPMLPVQYRGKLLTVNRHTGQIVNSFDLIDGDYGGIAYGENHLFISRLEPSEILKVNPTNGKIVQRIPISGPAGGLEYDKDKSVLIAQLYVGYPHLAVIDPKSGATTATLWSDESAMDLKKVDGDLLCTWVSGFDTRAFSELRLIDQQTGKVKGRITLDKVHSSLAPLDKKVGGIEGFISLVSLDKESGKVGIRKYSYTRDAVRW